jgi:hypothetical protein
MSTATATFPRMAPHELSMARLHLMRAGYALMAVGLALVKWPLLPGAHSMALYEGVTLILLTAMSLMAVLGLRYPVQMLPLLLLEAVWKLLWLSLVALPQAINGNLSTEMTETALNCSLVVLIIGVIPWRYVWTHYVRASGDPWRS